MSNDIDHHQSQEYEIGGGGGFNQANHHYQQEDHDHVPVMQLTQSPTFAANKNNMATNLTNPKVVRPSAVVTKSLNE